MEENKIKILISYHKPSVLLKNDVLTPIHLGRALATESSKDGIVKDEDLKWLMDNMIGDDTGDNISHLNRKFCEMTAVYWAWKNYETLGDPEYIGFMHYRRHFIFDMDCNLNNKAKDEQSFRELDEKYINKIGLTKDKIFPLLDGQDFLVPQIVDISNFCSAKSLTEQYKISKGHNIKDLNMTLDILISKYPEYSNVVTEYMQNTESYFKNIFIMKKEQFFDYCQWLFDILFEVEKRLDYSTYTASEYRAIGYLSERLTGIYLTNLISQKKPYKTIGSTLVENVDIPKTYKPAFDKNNVSVVYASNNNYVKYLAVSLKSLIDKSTQKNNYDVFVFETNISTYNKKLLNSMVKGLNNISLRFVNVNKYVCEKKMFIDRHLSIETYFRIFILKILANFEKVIYLDCDTLILEDIANLYNTDINGYLIGATNNISTTPFIARKEVLFNKQLDKYFSDVIGVKDPYDYFQAGVLLFNVKKMIEEDIFDKFFERLSELGKPIFHDQDTLNSICYGKVKFVHQSWDFEWRQHPELNKIVPKSIYKKHEEAAAAPKIIHFDGVDKVWQQPGVKYANYWWDTARKTPFYEQILYHNARLMAK